MSSTPGAGLLVYRLGGKGVEVLLFRPARSRSTGGGRESLQIPLWELGPPAGAGAPAGRAGRQFDSRPRVKQRVVARRSLGQLLDHARRSFAELTGLEPPGPFLPLGGVKMRLHRVVYVWACETAEAPAPDIPAGAGHGSPAAAAAGALEGRSELAGLSRGAYSGAEFLPFAEARALIEAQQRRFLDELEALLARPLS